MTAPALICRGSPSAMSRKSPLSQTGGVQPSSLQCHPRLILGWRGGSCRPPCLLFTEPGLSLQTMTAHSSTAEVGPAASFLSSPAARDSLLVVFVFFPNLVLPVSAKRHRNSMSFQPHFELPFWWQFVLFDSDFFLWVDISSVALL